MTAIQTNRGATPIDLDVMALIAEEAGRDASRKTADEATFETNVVLRTIPNFQTTLVIATRLYQACLAGATDPAAD